MERMTSGRSSRGVCHLGVYSWALVLAAAWAGASRTHAQYATPFELPDFVGSPGGTSINGQGGWFTPAVAGSIDGLVMTYTGNTFGLLPNPDGGDQFLVERSDGGTAFARAQHEMLMMGNTTVICYDAAALFNGAAPSMQNLGSFSLQPEPNSAVPALKSYIQLNTWVDPNNPTAWSAGYLAYDAAGVQFAAPGMFAGPEWQNLQLNHWYRFCTTVDFSQNRITSVSITDLTTNMTTTAQPVDWFIGGGQNSALPVPTGVRFFAGGGAGNVMGWDNLSIGPPPPLFDFGMPHSALGQAQLSIDPAGNLLVSNLGSTGQDGVSVSPGASEGMHLVMNLPDSSAIPIGATIRYRIHKTDQLLGEMLIERTPDGFQHTPDLSAGGSPTYALTLLLHGAVVFHRAGLSGTAGTVSELGAGLGICSHTSGNPPITHTSQEGAVASWRLTDGQTVSADTIVVDAEDTAFPLPGILQMDYLASGIPSFTVPAEFLMMFGTPTRMAQAHLALGSARFDAASGMLSLSNIGSSGQDGVRVDFDELGLIFALPAVRGISVQLAPVAPLEGESIDLSAVGVFSGAPASELGHAGLRNNAGEMQITADFSPIGADTVRVEVFSTGQLVGRVDVPGGGIVGTLGAGVRINGCGKLPPFQLPCFVLNSDAATDFVPTGGGPPLAGNEFRILALNAAGTIDRLSSFDIRSAFAIPRDLVILGENLTTTIPCAADFNGDGALNSQDFFDFLNAFFAGSVRADFNADGVVNSQDFFDFLNAFFAGC